MATLAEQLSGEQVADLKDLGRKGRSSQVNQSAQGRQIGQGNQGNQSSQSSQTEPVETAFERLTRPVKNAVRVSAAEAKRLNSAGQPQSQGRGRGWHLTQSEEPVL